MGQWIQNEDWHLNSICVREVVVSGLIQHFCFSERREKGKREYGWQERRLPKISTFQGLERSVRLPGEHGKTREALQHTK